MSQYKSFPFYGRLSLIGSTSELNSASQNNPLLALEDINLAVLFRSLISWKRLSGGNYFYRIVDY
jgi:hypothetical protein